MSPGVRRAAVGATTALAAVTALDRLPAPADGWHRTNYRGRTVSLAAGPALALAATVTGPGVAGALAGLGAGAAGAYVDARGAADQAKGFRGHVTALREGRLTAGGVKLVTISATGLLAAVCVRPRRDLLVTGAVIAGTANLLNLLDLRPGRALKAAVLLGVTAAPSPRSAAAAGAATGAALGVLGPDLSGQTMLGDTGANSAGALLGAALVQCCGRRGRLAALAVLTALTLASERVSFTRVIESTPGLRELDALGRR